MAVNFIKEIEVITVSLETQAGIAGNFVWSQGREKSQIKNILLQISIDKVGLRGLKKEKNKEKKKSKVNHGTCLPTNHPHPKMISNYSSVVSTSFTYKYQFRQQLEPNGNIY